MHAKFNGTTQVDLQLAGEEGDSSTYIENGEWDLRGEAHTPYNTDGARIRGGPFFLGDSTLDRTKKVGLTKLTFYVSRNLPS